MGNLTIRGCRIQNPGETAGALQDIYITNGVFTDKPAPGAEEIQADGCLAVPGFIEVHIQGAGGCDVLDNSYESLDAISLAQARYGVTSWLATTVYRPQGDNAHLSTVASYMAQQSIGAACLGIHLEGPFIALPKKGMIHPDCICLPDQVLVDDVLKQCDGALAMMTLAPELEGNLELAGILKSNGCAPSFGHSAADYEQTIAGIKAGVCHVTHTFNAMMPIHHREPGPFMAFAEHPEVTLQVISDGVHLHPAIVRHIYKNAGCKRIVLITDGMQAMGLPDGLYEYNGMEYRAENGAARYHDGTLIGTACGLSEIMKRFMDITGASLADTLISSCQTPAAVLGLEKRKGCIASGMDGDLVLMRDDLDIQKTIVGGAIAYSAD